MFINIIRKTFHLKNVKFATKIVSKMAEESSNLTHLERTAHNSRSSLQTDAVVKQITDISPTVKKLVLSIKDKSFSFLPGQWVDFSIPGVSTVGGFSMCSTGSQFRKTGEVDLAIKYSPHPPAHWVHTKCNTGDKVQVKVGGDFYFNPGFLDQSTKSVPESGDVSGMASMDILLIAGGVGINPLYSILQTVSECMEVNPRYKPSVCLFYSSKEQDELIFKDEILSLCQKRPSFSCRFHITQQKREGDTAPKQIEARQGRIDASVLSEVMQDRFPDKKKVACFLCGPGHMTDALESDLLELGLCQKQIYYEKWW